MQKCLKCNEKFNGNQAIGKHYRENPTHRRKYVKVDERSAHIVSKSEVSVSLQNALHRIIENPAVLTDAIDKLLKQNENERKVAEQRIRDLEVVRIRLETLKSTLTEDKVYQMRESA